MVTLAENVLDTAMSITSSVDLVQPWRKSFPLAKPPEPGNKADAKRFVREFPEGGDDEDLGNSWTLGDVLRGTHEGGLAAAAPVIGGNADVDLQVDCMSIPSQLTHIGM